MDNIFFSASLGAGVLYLIRSLTTLYSPPTADNTQFLEAAPGDIAQDYQEEIVLEVDEEVDPNDHNIEVRIMMVNSPPVIGDGDMPPVEVEIPSTRILEKRSASRKRSHRTKWIQETWRKEVKRPSKRIGSESDIFRERSRSPIHRMTPSGATIYERE